MTSGSARKGDPAGSMAPYDSTRRPNYNGGLGGIEPGGRTPVAEENLLAGSGAGV
jgi:hypothetical protein